MFDLLRSRTRDNGAVQSLMVQAARPTSSRRRVTSQSTLVRHLLSRFMADDSGDDEETSSRMLMACGIAAVPGLFLAIFLYPAYHPIALRPLPRPYWSQVGDQYLYVLYSFVTMGIAAALQSDAIFPDLLDVFALSTLPVSSRKLFRARCIAILLLFGSVMLCVNLLGMVFFSFDPDSPNILRRLMAHTLATFTAGVFSCCVTVTLQSGLEIVFGSKVQKRIAPIIQTAWIVALIGLVGLTPFLLDHTKLLVQGTDTRASLIPSLWFEGIYQQVLGMTSSVSAFHHLARMGWLATTVAVAAAAATYPLAYERRTQSIVESGNASGPTYRAPHAIITLMHRVFLRRAGHRATFHFAAQTIFRSSKHRTAMTLITALGIAIAFSTSLDAAPRAVAIVICALSASCCSTMLRPYSMRSAWVFRMLCGAPSAAHLGGCVRLSIFWSFVLATGAALALLVLYPVTRVPADIVPLLLFSLTLPIIFSELLFLELNDFPFTIAHESTPERLMFSFLKTFLALPLSIVILGWSYGMGTLLPAALLVVGVLVSIKLRSAMKGEKSAPIEITDAD